MGPVSAPPQIKAGMVTPKAYRAPVQKARAAARRLKSRATVMEESGNGANPQMTAVEKTGASGDSIRFHGVHHVGLLCENLERSMAFYEKILGLELNHDRPDKKLPYRGAWLWIGPEMIHLMELPNPDPKDGRPVHGGRDRHFCIGVESIEPLVDRLTSAGIKFTESMSGRPAVFFRDPDMNCLEIVEMKGWR